MKHIQQEFASPELVFVPFLTRARFAALVGITEDVLERWIRDDRVRTYRIGKRSLVDLRQWMRAQQAGSHHAPEDQCLESRPRRPRRVAPASGAEQ